ncbi:DUF4185 domain-containing protein [Modestobacter sp. I12A-02628]|uniref:DUF4185 domain-containing protein n=1 Tax=Goekera deserti TaxID=2497753 RepID=A0A7K3WC50_9ACTN|nr:DUF4185 domain-containing protein [Goekera deserti]MPQ98378.1 DUF4185 domain-containing protein [Goekera deserti]NDI48205.1 DUF4185 domain-containing protein [Goekera deserti]NEL53954.1 DUF4185 domain-containing protein [Goekera deserti]
MPRSPLSRSLVGTLAAALVLTGCSTAGTVRPAVGGNALAPACPPVGGSPLVSADLVNELVSGADLPGWQAADIGASARLSDGRLVWVFGDTVRAADVTPRIVANSMLVTAGSCVSQLVAPDGGPVVPDAEDGTVMWPMSVSVMHPGAQSADDPVSDIVVVLCARTRRGDGGSMDFQFRGTSAAVFTVSDGGAPQLRQVVEVTPDDGSAYQVNWGAASTVHDGWLHVYGTRFTGLPLEFGRELHAARVRVGAVGTRSSWEFWAGDRWQRDRTRSTPVLPAAGGVSQTLSVDHVDGRWVAVSKKDGDLGDFVFSWTAPTPVGPWQPRAGVPAPAGFDTGDLSYTPLAHPDVELASGRLLVSISRNTLDFARLLEDPTAGQPVFTEIPYP